MVRDSSQTVLEQRLTNQGIFVVYLPIKATKWDCFIISGMVLLRQYVICTHNACPRNTHSVCEPKVTGPISVSQQPRGRISCVNIASFIRNFEYDRIWMEPAQTRCEAQALRVSSRWKRTECCGFRVFQKAPAV